MPSGSRRPRGAFDLASKRLELKDLHEASTHPDFWQDTRVAQRTLRRADLLRTELGTWDDLRRRATDLVELNDLSASDPAMEQEVDREYERLAGDYERARTSLLFRGEYDDGDALLTISAGAGGTEATDWAEMLLRMYLRWAERRRFKTEVLDETPGEEAGLKSVTVGIAGVHAYGLLHAERGVHRLVRLSPYDAQNRRHTTFALVEVLPDTGEDVEIEIGPDDLRIDTFRATGAGGQHVNKTDSAVRITHLPTGIAAQSQNERSQMQNRATAMKILRARLLERAMREREEELARIKGKHVEAGWGNQIRSYVLHPYQLVKDHRTEVETSNTGAVLDGDIDTFITAELEREATDQGAAA